MNPLKNMIRDAYKKIDSANSNFCSTPTGSPSKLTNRIAKTLLSGKGNADALLTSVAKDKEDRCSHKKPCTP